MKKSKPSSLRTLAVALSIGAALFLTSCSTSVQITSQPPGADVEINGMSYGQTPTTTTLSDFDFTEYRLTLKKLGYQDKTVVLEKETKVGAVIGGFFLWPIWLWAYGPMDQYNFKLEPKQSR